MIIIANQPNPDEIRQKEQAFLKTIPKAETLPIPAGYIRLFHQTTPETLKKIKSTRTIDLSFSTGKQNKEPVAIWAHPKGFYDQINKGRFYSKPTVEFAIPQQDQDAGRVLRSITPDEIIAFHEPWHQIAEYLIQNGQTKDVINGEFDYLLNTPDYKEAILAIKNFFL